MPHIIKIDGIIGWEVDIHDIREQLEAADGKDVVVEIASPGGLISEGLKIYNELKNYKGNVDTHLTGMVASMATYIAMVGKHRTAENNAIFMIHNGSGFAIGDHRLMFKFGNHLNSMTNIIAKEYVAKTGTDLAKIREAMDETTYYYGDEIKDAGFVHEMIGDAAPEDRAEAVALAELMFDACQTKINTPDLIKKDMKALSTLMADEPSMDVNQEIERLRSDNLKFKARLKVVEPKKEGIVMTLAEFQEKHPDVYKQIVALGLAEGVTQGVAQERDRVKMLVEMRAKFPKPHSQKVIDQAIIEGHELNQVSINLMSAEQAAAEVAKAAADAAKPPPNGVDVPLMKDGEMTHSDHLDETGARIASLPGVMS